MEEELDLEMDLYDIFAVMSGKDKSGYNLTGGTIAIDEILPDKEEPDTIENAPMDCEFTVYCEGGAVVLQCDFEGQNLHEYKKVMEICDHYIKIKSENPSGNEVLSLVAVPIALDGQISILFQGLTYYTEIDLGAVKRIILVFDNTLTQTFYDESVDLREIQLSVEAELSRQRADIEQQLMDAQEEYRKVTNNNPYEELIKESYSLDNIINDDNKSDNYIDEDSKVNEKKRRSDDTWAD